jgi:hypothetical protein
MGQCDANTILVANPKGRNKFGNPGVDGRIILKYTLNKYGVKI